MQTQTKEWNMESGDMLRNYVDNIAYRIKFIGVEYITIEDTKGQTFLIGNDPVTLSKFQHIIV